MFTFRLCSPAGDDLGTYKAALPNWRPGDVLYERGTQKYKVRSVIAADDIHGSPCTAILEVEEL